MIEKYLTHLHTLEEYAKHIGVSKPTIYNRIENGNHNFNFVYIGSKKFIYDERYTNQQNA